MCAFDTSSFEILRSAMNRGGAVILTFQRDLVLMSRMSVRSAASKPSEDRRVRLAVEEQDRAFYVIHFSSEPNDLGFSLFVVADISELRSGHVQWVAEHPGWNGWLGVLTWDTGDTLWVTCTCLASS